MPEKVPLYVLCSQLVHRFISLIKTVFRGLTVVIVWLIVLPNFTLWTWRFYFWSGENIGFGKNNITDLPFASSNTTTTESMNESSTFFSLGILKSFLTDCLEGQIITAFVIIIFVAAYLFREWVMQNLPVEQQLPEEVVVLNNPQEQLVQEQVAIDTLLNAMQVMNPPTNQQEQAYHDLNRIEHQLDHLRVELENELAQRNNLEHAQRHDWSSSLNDRIVPENEDELFGGLNGLGSSSSNDIIHDDEHYYSSGDEPDQEYRNIKREQDHQHHDDRSESSITRRRRNIVQYDSQDEDEDDELPDLIDQDQFDNAHFQRMFEQHIARRRELEGINDVAAVATLQHAAEVAAVQQVHQRQEQEVAQLQQRVAQLQRQDIGVVAAAANAAAEDEEPFDVGDDINGVLEAIGMRGNPWMLVQNSVLMSLMISLCLGIAVWIPYVIGRLVILVGVKFLVVEK
jgi:uncharacterized protein YdcH (DUF465 family)